MDSRGVGQLDSWMLHLLSEVGGYSRWSIHAPWEWAQCFFLFLYGFRAASHTHYYPALMPQAGFGRPRAQWFIQLAAALLMEQARRRCCNTALTRAMQYTQVYDNILLDSERWRGGEGCLAEGGHELNDEKLTAAWDGPSVLCAVTAVWPER